MAKRTAGGTALEFSVTGRYKQLIEGTLPVESLDLEELARCQLKDRNGRFTGQPPKVLPRSLIMRMRSEFFKRGDKAFEDSYVAAVETMVNIMGDAKVDPGVRLKAAQYVVERVRGKTPDVLVVGDGQAPWQVLIESIVVPVAAIEDADVVDGEVV